MMSAAICVVMDRRTNGVEETLRADSALFLNSEAHLQVEAITMDSGMCVCVCVCPLECQGKLNEIAMFP